MRMLTRRFVRGAVAAALAAGLCACGGDDATLRSLQAAGVTARNTVEHRVVNVDISGETAEVQDCFVDTTEEFSATTGESLGGASTTTMHADVLSTTLPLDPSWGPGPYPPRSRAVEAVNQTTRGGCRSYTLQEIQSSG